MDGWLVKKGRRRFFVLQHSKLLYYNTTDTKVPANGFIDLLSELSVEPSDSAAGTCSFRIVLDNGRVFDLQADSDGERQAWLDLRG